MSVKAAVNEKLELPHDMEITPHTISKMEERVNYHHREARMYLSEYRAEAYQERQCRKLLREMRKRLKHEKA